MRDQVTYYLDRARAAARSTVIGTVTDIRPVIDGLVRTFGKIYRDRGIRFEAVLPDGLRFRGERQDLEDLVGNLVDNAGKWAEARVVVSVSTINDPGELGPSALLISVDDDGRGLDEEARSVVTRRPGPTAVPLPWLKVPWVVYAPSSGYRAARQSFAQIPCNAHELIWANWGRGAA